MWPMGVVRRPQRAHEAPNIEPSMGPRDRWKVALPGRLDATANSLVWLRDPRAGTARETGPEA